MPSSNVLPHLANKFDLRFRLLTVLTGLCLLGGAIHADVLAAAPARDPGLQLRTSKLGESPELSSRDRVQRLEAELSSLREQTILRNADMEALRAGLKQSGEQQGQHDLWWVLAAMAGAGLAGFFAWLMAAQRRVVPPRREPAMDDRESDDNDVRLAYKSMAFAAAGQRQPANRPPAPARPAETASLELEAVSRWPESGPAPVAARQPSVFAPLAAWPASIPGPLSAHQPTHGVLLEGGFQIEALLATQQQVDFFISLDDIRAAIGVLETYLASSATPPPLAWLQLLGLHHRQQDQASFELLSERFYAASGVRPPSWRAPEWDVASQAGLDAFAQARSEVISVWQTQVVLEVLESLLFQMPASRASLLSPLAYRELLWLYEVALEPIYRSSEPPALQRRADQEPQAVELALPWLQSQDLSDAESLAPFDRVEPAPESVLMGLDLDLGTPWNPQREDIGESAFDALATARIEPSQAEADFDAAMGSAPRRVNFR